MPVWQVIEKHDFATDWTAVRYHDAAVSRYDTEEAALEEAKKYVTSVNVDNALASTEKELAAECFMMTDDGVFLGLLEGKDWLMRYKKDIAKSGSVVFHKDDPVKDSKYFELEGKTEVAVRVVPGT